MMGIQDIPYMDLGGPDGGCGEAEGAGEGAGEPEGAEGAEEAEGDAVKCLVS